MMKAIRQQVLFKQALHNVINLKFLGAGLLLLVLLLLTGCGEDAFVCESADCSASSTTSTTTTTTTTTTSSGIQMGYGTGASFILGTVNVGSTALLTGGSTTVSVNLVNADQTAYTTSTIVTFAATCASSSFASSSIGTSAGLASTSYTAGNCATDTVTATATIGTEVLGANSPTITITTPVNNILLGSGSLGTFVAGTLEIGITGTLSAGGTTTVEATVVDGDAGNALYSAAPITVLFTSGCVGTGQAVFSNDTVDTVNGIAITQYTASGCNPTDTITATANINGAAFTATATIDIAPASVSRIQFVSATPEVIAIEGTGTGSLQETSTVVFEVLDNNGAPIQNQVVTFGLDTTLGGLALVNLSDATAIDGTVQTIVDSGAIHTPFRVTAQTTDAISGITYSTQSPALVVSTGLADQDSFSLSISNCAPESYSIDGVTSSINIIASDHFNNPVPEGTAISFTTEGGSIQGSCTTNTSGACSVTWTSSNPRPPGDGRTTILATALGNESYTDLNSDGHFGNGDLTGDDLPEAWRDDNENGVYDAASEEFLDFDGSTNYTGADGAWTGVDCQDTTGRCATATTLNVRQQGVIIMATTGNVATINGGAAIGPLPGPTLAPQAVPIVVRGTTGQYPATGTTISVETTNGTIVGTSTFTVPNTCGAGIGTGYTATVYMNGDGTPSTGILTVTITSPSAVESPLYTQTVGD